MKTNCLKNQAYWKTTVTNGNIYWIIITTASLDHFLQLCDNLCSPLGKWGHRVFLEKEIRGDNIGSSKEAINKST